MSDGNTTTSITPEDIAALQAYVFDLDGVIWRGSEPVEGAVESVQRLRAAGKRILYCTNNSSKTSAAYAERLRGMGLELDDEDVLTSSWATAAYLSAQFTGPFSVFVIGEEGVHSALQKTGARIVPEHDVDEETRVDCVVVGIERSFSYQRLCVAQQLILRGAQFVATNRDATYPVENGVLPGSGSIVAAVEAASGTTPVVIGKPRPAMLQLALEKFGLRPETTAMVGDRLDTDIAAARNAGILALFVATGVTTPVQARKAKGQQRPHALFPNLPALCQIALDSASAGATATGASAAGASAAGATATDATASGVLASGAPAMPEPSIASESPAVETAPVETAPVETSLGSEAPPDVTPEESAASTPGKSSGFEFADDFEAAAAAGETAAEEAAPAPEEAASTAAAVESGLVADEIISAPGSAAGAAPEAETPAEKPTAESAAETGAEGAAGASAAEDEAWDMSELENIEWGAEADASARDELAKTSTEPADSDSAEKDNDPFASWFEAADEKKS